MKERFSQKNRIHNFFGFMNVEIFFNVIVEEGIKLFLSLNSFLKNHISTFKKGYYMWMWKYIFCHFEQIFD